MMKFLKKNPGAHVLMSAYVQKDLLHLETPANHHTWRHRVWIFCHGTYLTMLIGEILVVASYACTLTNKPNEFEFFYTSAFFVTFFIGALYQIFWLRRRTSTTALFERLLALTKKLEVDFNEKELEISKSARRTMMTIIRCMQTLYIGEVLFGSVSPISDVRLPPFLQGMKPFSPGMLAPQVAQSFIILSVTLAVAEFLITETKLVLFLTNGYRIIGRRFRHLDMTNERKVRDTVRLHSEWMALSAETEKEYLVWNLVYASHMLSIALICTVGVISGVHEFEVVLLMPSAAFYLYMVCRFGEFLKEQSSSVANDIYEGHWLNGNGKLRRMLVFSILKAHRPARLRATLIGPLTLERFLDLSKQWYSFLQFMLNIKI